MQKQNKTTTNGIKLARKATKTPTTFITKQCNNKCYNVKNNCPKDNNNIYNKTMHKL